MSGFLDLFKDTSGTHQGDLNKWKRDEMQAMLEEILVMRRHWINDMGKSITQLPKDLKNARKELADKQRTLLTLEKRERDLLTGLMISVNRDHQLANWVTDRQQAETREVRQALGHTLDRALEAREKKQWEQEGQEWIGRWQAWKKGASEWDKWEEYERQWEERERQWELDWEEYAQTRWKWMEMDPSQQAEMAQNQVTEKSNQWERDRIERDREWKELERNWEVWRQWEQTWDKEEEKQDEVEQEQDREEQEHHKGQNQLEESERQWREEQWEWRRQARDWRDGQRQGRKQERQRQEEEQHRWKQQWRRRQGRQRVKQEEKRTQEERRREEQQQWQKEIQRRAKERRGREEERHRREGERQQQKEERERRSRELERQHQQRLQMQMHWEKRQKVREQERQERARQEQLTQESPDLQWGLRSKRRKRLENEQAKAQKWEKEGLELSLSLSNKQLVELKELQLLARESLPLCIVLVQQWEQQVSQLEMEWNSLEPSKVQLEHAQAADAASLERAGRDWPKLVSLAERWVAQTSLTSWFPLDEQDLKERRHKHRPLDVMLDNHSAFTNQSPKLDALLVFAGLFSAILSAFLIEIRKGLEEDLLLAILQQLQNTIQPFQPTPVSIWVNALWFTSLAASLAGTLVVMLAKSRGQWTIDEKEAEALFSTPKGLRRRRVEIGRLHIHTGFKQEFALLIATASILVYVALILFSSGLSFLLYTICATTNCTYQYDLPSQRPTRRGIDLGRPIRAARNPNPLVLISVLKEGMRFKEHLRIWCPPLSLQFLACRSDRGPPSTKCCYFVSSWC